MKVGFTGTREGTTEIQSAALATALSDLTDATAFGHGGCVGADETFSNLCFACLPEGTPQEVFPGKVPRSLRGAFPIGTGDTIHPEKPPLDRNHDIVDWCGILLACPKGPEEQRSGTWATIRYAVKQGKPVRIIWPDGSIEER